MTILLLAAFLQTGTVWAALSTPTPTSFADLVAQVQDSVVNISTTEVVNSPVPQEFGGPNSPFRQFFGDDFFKHFFGNMPRKKMRLHALGSGFVIDSSGLILTNNHVIDKATEIKVKLKDEHEYAAKVLGRDPKTDLALLKVTPDKYFPKALKLGDSNAIRVGDPVLAVGNPFGLGNTVTSGIISAKGRIIGAGPYDDFLQTDAAINPGNSGGPLFNLQGQVIGINTAIVARGQGIGFAIPIDMAKELLPQLKAGSVTRGWLGVMIQDITPELAESFSLKSDQGVLVSDVVKNGPAAKAGFERGDVVVSFNGKPVTDAHDLSRMVASYKPGTKVNVGIIRNGRDKQLKTTLGTMPKETATPSQSNTEEQKSSWGLQLQNLTPDVRQELGLGSDVQGVVVTGIMPGSPASGSGIQPGDLIQEVNRHKVNDLQEFQKTMSQTKPNKRLLLLVARSNHTFYVVLQPAQNQ